MHGHDHWKSTDPDELNSDPQAGYYPGLRPMSEAPRDDYTKTIIVILADTDENEDPRREVFWDAGDWMVGEGRWMDANGDGAPDSSWDWWTDDELDGWLPVPEDGWLPAPEEKT